MTSWPYESVEVGRNICDRHYIDMWSNMVMFSSSITPKLRTTLTAWSNEITKQFNVILNETRVSPATMQINYIPHPYSITLWRTMVKGLYNPFTIVLHKRLSAYPFRAARTPARCLGTKRNKDFPPATPQPIGNQDYWPNPLRRPMWI